MSSTYWCHRCNSFVRAWNPDSMNSPNCNTGFVEQVDTPIPPSLSHARDRPFPSVSMYMMRRPRPCPFSGPRRSRRNVADRSPFNPVIVLRGPNDGGGGFELYYDDEAGSGLLPLPPTVSEFLLGSGFDRLLEQLSQIEANWMGSADNTLPASKAAIDSMPAIEIIEDHISMEWQCAICKEAFEMGNEVREMPCKHLYHENCIVAWLSLRNSCPVCRQEVMSDKERCGNEGGEDGLTIWRLPGGGYAVGRFSGGERELPVVYTEMDGGFNNNGARRIAWGSRGTVSRNRGGLRRRLFNGLFSCFGRGSNSRRSGSLSSDILMS